MLMQIVAWVLAAPALILLAAYAMIFASMLAAKFRQAHAGLDGPAAPSAIRDLRHVAPARVDALRR